MPDWTAYVRSHLLLRGLRPDRETAIVEDLARQLEDAYRDALAAGMSEADALTCTTRHVSDWEGLSRELERLPNAAMPVLEGLQERASTASDSRRWWAFFGGLLRDGLLSFRMMRKSPGFTFIVVLTLALGIGATTAIFGVVDAVLLRPLPYPNADRLVMMWELGNRRDRAVPEVFSVSWQDYQDWRRQARSVEHLGVFRMQNANLTRVNPPERLRVSMTSADVFSALAVQPLLGRTFVPQEDEPGAAPTVVLSETLWRSRFAAAGEYSWSGHYTRWHRLRSSGCHARFHALSHARGRVGAAGALRQRYAAGARKPSGTHGRRAPAPVRDVAYDAGGDGYDRR